MRRHSLSLLACLAAVAGLLTLPGQAAADLPVTNRLPNASFEVDADRNGCPDQWNCTASQTNASYTLDPTGPFDGQRSVKLHAPTNDDRVVVQRYRQPAVEFTTYRVSVRYRAADVRRAGGHIKVWFHNAAGEVIHSKTAYGPAGTTDGWVPVHLEGEAPAGTTSWTVDFGLFRSAGTVWFDLADGESYGGWRVYGDTRLVRVPGESTDTLTLRLGAPRDPAAIDAIDAFGTELRFNDCSSMRTPSGQVVTLTREGSIGCDTANRRYPLPVGAERPGTLRLGGIRFNPPAGRSYPPVFVHDANGNTTRVVFVMTEGFGATDYEQVRQVGADVHDAAARLHRYLETRRTRNQSGAYDGAWLIYHPEEQFVEQGGARRDPHGISAIIAGHLRMYQVTREQVYRDRAVAGLNWLVGKQDGNGSWGLPWTYNHTRFAGHYPSGDRHPVDSPYAIITANAGNALVEGYRTLADDPARDRWKDAAVRARNALFTGPNGFQWLPGTNQQRGHIPYCIARPIVANDPDGHTEVYNVDGAALAFYVSVSRITDDRPVDERANAVARNIAHHIEADGSLVYADYAPQKPVGYAILGYGGLMTWANHADGPDSVAWRRLAARGLSWGANVDGPLVLTGSTYLSTYGLDATQDMILNLRAAVVAQLDDGSYSGGKDTRGDAARFAGLGAALLQMGYPVPRPGDSGERIVPSAYDVTE